MRIIDRRMISPFPFHFNFFFETQNSLEFGLLAACSLDADSTARGVFLRLFVDLRPTIVFIDTIYHTLVRTMF